MTRLQDPLAGVNFSVGAVDDPLEGVNFLSQGDDAALRIPKLYEFMGVEPAESPEAAQGQAHQALDTGAAKEYASYLRAEWEGLQPGTPGRRDLYKNMKQLERETAYYDRVVRPAAERQRKIDAAIGRRLQEAPIFEDEFKFGLTPLGQAMMEFQFGAQQAITAPLELASIAAGDGTLAGVIRNERDFRRRYLDLIQSHGDVKAVLGETASNVYNGAAQTFGSVAFPARLAGGYATPATFTAVATQGLARGAEEAEKLGLSGGDAFRHAALQTGWELSMMAFFGRIGKGLGFDSFEEALSRRGRAMMKAVGEKLNTREMLAQLGKTLGGAGVEMTEEFITDIGQQLVTQQTRPDEPTNWGQAFTAAMTGAASRLGLAGADAIKADAEARQRVDDAMKDAKQQIADYERLMATNQAFIVETLRGGADVEAALASAFVTQDHEGPSLGPVTVTEPAPVDVTDLPSEIAEASAEAVVPPASAETPVQEGEGAAEIAVPATYPEGIDAALQRAQVEEFIKTATPEKVAELFSTRETIAPQVEVESQVEAVAPTEAVAETTIPDRPLAAAEAITRQEAAPAAEILSETDTAQQNFTELTGIEGTSLAYRDAFVDALAAYVPPFQQPAVLDVPQEPVAESQTREQIRINARDRKIQFQKETIRRLRQEVRNARELRQDWLDDTAFLVEANIPAEHQSAFLNAIRTTDTPSKFKRLLDRVDKWVARHDYDNAWMNFDKARGEATGLRSDWQARADELKQGAEKLKRSSLSKMSPDTINAAVDELNSRAEKLNEAVYNNGVQNTLLATERAIGLENFAGEMTSQLGRAKPLSLTTAPSGFRGLIPKFFRKTDWEENPRRKLNLFSVDSPIHRELSTRPEALMRKASEQLTDLVYERFFIDGSYARDSQIVNLTNQLGDVLQSQGLTWAAGTSAFTLGGEQTSRLEQWRETHREIAGTRMSRGEALLLALNMRDPESAAKLREEGGVLSHRKRRTFRPVDEFFEAEIANFLGDEGRVIADHIFAKINSDVIDPVNQAEEVISGHPVTTRRQHFPRKVDDEAITPDNDSFGEKWRGAVMDSYTHLRERKRTDKPLEIDGDGIDFYMRHVEKMATYAAYAVPHRDVMTTLNRQDVKDSLRAHGGELFYNMLIDRVNRQVAPERVPRSWGEHGLSATTKLIAASRLAGRIGPAAKQVLAAPVLFAHVDPGVMAVAQKRFRTDFRGLRARMLQNPFAQQRYSSHKYAHEFTNGLVANTGFFRPTPITDRMMTPMSLAEREGTGILKQALAEETVARRMSADDPRFIDEVNKEWFRLTVRAENNAEGMELNSIQAYARDHAMAAPFVMFSSSAGRAYTTFVQGLDEIREGQYASGTRKLSGVLGVVVAEAMMDDLLSWEDVPGDWVERVSKRALVGMTSLSVAAREFVTPIARAILGMNVYRDDVVPQFGVAQDAGMVVSQFANAVAAEGHSPQQADKIRGALDRIAKTLVPGYAGAKDIGRRAVEGTPLPGLSREVEKEWNFR